MLLLDLVEVLAVIDSEAPSVPSDTRPTVSTSMCDRIHMIKPKNALMLKLHFLHTIYHDFNMSQSILIFFRTSS